MKDKVFIDTNVLIYLYSVDEPNKKQKAISVFDNYDCITSTQAINEFCNICIKKMRKNNKDIALAVNEIINICKLELIGMWETINTALQLHNRYNYSYFDCLMLASALNSNCKCIFTEDMSDGQIINDKLKIINIFKT
jgi:predicted nucleic acid-binding protein